MIPHNNTNSINVTISSGILFNRKYDIAELEKIIHFIDKLDAPKFSFSLIRSDYGSKQVRTTIHQKLNVKIYNYLKETFKRIRDSSEPEKYECEITHKHADKFYTSEEIVISRSVKTIATFDSPFSISLIELLQKIYSIDKKLINEELDAFDRLLDKSEMDLAFNNFGKFLNSYKIKALSRSTSKDPVLSGSLIEFLAMEMELDERKYFLLDGKWLRTQESFLKTLDINLQKILNYSFIQIDIHQKWKENLPCGTSEGENQFLERLQKVQHNDQLVMHKIIPRDPKIELCDILKVEDGKTYLCHLKPGFQGEMRTLAAQIIHSAQIIIDYHNSGDFNTIQKYFDASKNGNSQYREDAKKRFTEFTLNKFKEAFSQDKEIIFVGVICDEDRCLKTQISNCSSIIAKLATYDLFNFMASISYQKFTLKLMQL